MSKLEQSESTEGEVEDETQQQLVSDLKKELEIKNEVMKLMHLLPARTQTVSQFL